MEKLMKGDIVVIPFPFSDLSKCKRRPALVVAKPFGEDVLLAQITSQDNMKNYSIDVNISDFFSGSLPIESFVKVNRLFSADIGIIKYKVGKLNKSKVKEIENKIIEFVRR